MNDEVVTSESIHIPGQSQSVTILTRWKTTGIWECEYCQRLNPRRRNDEWVLVCDGCGARRPTVGYLYA